MKKKKIVIVTIIVIGVLVLSFFIGAGFRRRTDVVLTEYSVSEDGKKLNFNVGVMSSMGYIRGFKDGGGGVKPHYLTFFSTFGGLNSSFGAKSEFELDLDENDAEIYFVVQMVDMNLCYKRMVIQVNGRNLLPLKQNHL